MNIEKMNQLADFLENLESDRFHISYWVSEKYVDNNNEISHYEGEIIDIDNCGTAGCIAGWALALEKNGKVAVVEDHYDEEEYWKEFCPVCEDYHRNFCPRGYSTIHIENIEKVAAGILGLTQKESRMLFIPDKHSIWHRYAHDYGVEQDSEISVYYSNIKSKHAADMLRRIVSGEIVLGGDDE